MFIILIQSSFTLIHVGILGALSLIASYGLNKMKRWSIFLISVLFFPSVTFGATTIYATIKFFNPDLTTIIFQSLMIVYLILLTASFFYVVTKRKEFK